MARPASRPQKVKTKIAPKRQRDREQVALIEILNGLLDSGLMSHCTIHVSGVEQGSYYNYIVVRQGELDEERYDRFRKVVNGLGGMVLVADYDRHGEQGNIRIWPRGNK